MNDRGTHGLFMAIACSIFACRASSIGDNASSSTDSPVGSTSRDVETLGSTATPDETGRDATTANGTSAGTDLDPGTSTAGGGPATGGDTTANTDITGTTADSGANDGKLCALSVIDPAADPAIVDAGDQPGQIPAVVGAALLRNCGCHYTDDADGYIDYVSDAVPMNTHADFHSPFEGLFPTGFADRLTWEACEVRVLFGLPSPMPSNECGVDGEPGNIGHADFVLFAQWFEAGAPDAASFP